MAGEPVMTNDVSMEDRFDFPACMREGGQGARRRADLPGGRPFGLLQVDATEPRAFGHEET
jgi:hypothetical protein